MVLRATMGMGDEGVLVMAVGMGLVGGFWYWRHLGCVLVVATMGISGGSGWLWPMTVVLAHGCNGSSIGAMYAMALGVMALGIGYRVTAILISISPSRCIFPIS
ncbi:hypothetical protein U1Q18_001302 [Sarracenia purpurea var. burkii]